VDAIIQSQRCHIINDRPTRDIAFTVAQADAELACQVISELDRQINCGQVSGDKAIAKLSVVGAGMIGHPGVAAKFFASLAQENINIQMITTSEIKISCVIDEQDGIKALQAVHEAFGLGGKEQIIIPA
jgi:aspartate kinase